MANGRARAHGSGRAPGRTGAGRRSPGRVRFTGVLLILLALISAALCFYAFTAWLPADRDRYQDYRAAGPCPAHPAEQVAADCLSTWHFTVVNTVVKTGKGGHLYANLKDEGSWRGRVNFGDPGPLLDRLKPDDRVTATVWRRDIVVLGKDGVRQDSSDAPRDELQMNAALGLFGAFVAAQAFVFGAVRLVRPRRHGPFTWNPYGRRLLVTSAAICFGVGLPAVWTGIPWWTVPTLTIPLVLVMAVVLYRHQPHRTAAL